MPRLVVIIEDTATLAASLALALNEIADVEIATFGSAREALRFLKGQDGILRAIVTDLNLPDEDGFALIRKIRRLEPGRVVPAILITAQEDPGARDGDILGEPNVIIKKPFSMKEVRRVLETLL